jgi:hypothetical protein
LTAPGDTLQPAADSSIEHAHADLEWKYGVPMQNNRINRRLSTIIAACVLVGSAGVADAASISWAVPTNILNDNDVSLARDLVAAYNVGNADVAAATVNGVTFAPFAIPDGDYTATHDDYLISSIDGFSGYPMHTAINFGSNAAPFTALSTNYQALLRSGSETSTTNQFMALAFFALNVGDTYTIQIWFNRSQATAVNSDPIFVVRSHVGYGVSVIPNVTGGEGGTGQFLLGTFVADSTVQEIGLDGQGFNIPGERPSNGVPVMSAFHLRTTAANTPEPSSALAMASSALVLRRSRRH